MTTIRSYQLNVPPAGLQFDTYHATVDGRALRLSDEEYQLLALLVSHIGQVLRHRDIYANLWGTHVIDDLSSMDGLCPRQRLRLLVSHLRHEIEGNAHGQGLIQTVQGVGYRVERPVKLISAQGKHCHALDQIG